MCSHDVLQHKYQNHSPLTHQQYRAAGVHWLALGRRGGEPVVQQNKAHKKLGRRRPHLINSWAQLQLDAPLNKILDCHWRGPAVRHITWPIGRESITVHFAWFMRTMTMKHGFMVRDLELYRGLCRSGEREGRRRSHGIDFSAMCTSQTRTWRRDIR